MIPKVFMFILVLVTILPWTARAESDCRHMSRIIYEAAPEFVYTDQPDSLLGLLLEWEDICGYAEPVMRLKILASIWDGAFQEAIYDSRIIDALIWRYDSKRQKIVTGKVDADLASGGIASEADFTFGMAAFDTFTTEWADQLLPHTSSGTIEAFFCLFYSGQVDAAFEMLHGDDLSSSDLQWYYQREMSYLRQEEPRPVFALTGGYWRPSGELLRVGNHYQWGCTLGVRHDRWLARMVFEIRPGRTDYPYRVDDGEYEGLSNRFDNVYLGFDVGRELVSYGRHRVDVFVGLGFDSIKPFWEEDLVLGTVNANLGIGYRVLLGDSQNWIAGVDYRSEHVGTRNSGGTDLSGEATCVRLSFGYVFDKGNGRRLSGVGH